MIKNLVNKILNNTISETDLVSISNNFIDVCYNIEDLNKVFTIMTEQYLSNVIQNILFERYDVTFIDKSCNEDKKYYRSKNKYEDFGNQYFSQFSVQTFINHFLKLKNFTNENWRVYDFLNPLDYDIINNYNITANNNILDNYILHYSKNSIPKNIVVHYISLNNNRFIDSGYAHYGHNKGLRNANCLKKDYNTNIDYKYIYIDIYAKKTKGCLSKEDALKLIDVAISKNYYDIFMDCYNTGLTLTQDHFLLHLKNFCTTHEEYTLKNPFKILEHMCKIEKFKLTLDLEMSEQLMRPEIFDLVSDVTFDNIKKYYETGNYINIHKYNYSKDQIDILYNVLFKNYVIDNNTNITLFVKDITDPQYIFREMFKKSTITQIKNYMKINKLEIDQWCIDNAFVSSNMKVIKIFMEKNIYPSLNVSLLLLEKKKYVKIREYLRENVIKNYDFSKYKDVENCI